MKRSILIFALVAMLAPVACIAQDANRMQYLQLYAPGTSLAATSAAVDVSAYKGNATFAVQSDPSTVACTNTATLTHCATSGGTYATATNLAGTACVVTQTGPATNDIQTVAIDLARLHKYVKVVVAQSGQQTNAMSAFLVAPFKSE